MKVAELQGPLLDYWVARAEGYDPDQEQVILHIDGTCRIAWHEGDDPDSRYSPSTNWMWGGPIIERSLISVLYYPVDSISQPGYWTAFIRPSDDKGFDAKTPLLAAMRAYVTSKFGEEVPDSAN